MKIKVKALSAEIEMELPDETQILAYHLKSGLIPLIQEMKISVIEIEKKIKEIHNVKSDLDVELKP